MKTLTTRAFLLLGLASVVAHGAARAAAQSAADLQIDSLVTTAEDLHRAHQAIQRKMNELDARQATTESNVARLLGLQEEFRRLNERLNQMDQRLSACEATVGEIKAETGRASADLGELTGQVRALRDDLRSEKAAVREALDEVRGRLNSARADARPDESAPATRWAGSAADDGPATPADDRYTIRSTDRPVDWQGEREGEADSQPLPDPVAYDAGAARVYVYDVAVSVAVPRAAYYGVRPASVPAPAHCRTGGSYGPDRGTAAGDRGRLVYRGPQSSGYARAYGSSQSSGHTQSYSYSRSYSHSTVIYQERAPRAASASAGESRRAPARSPNAGTGRSAGSSRQASGGGRRR